MSRLVVVVLSVLGGCAAPDPCADKRDLSNSPAGLTLTAAEHPAGWGRAECFQCHQRWNVHQDDCIDGVAIGPIDTEQGCASCHGGNGVSADTGGAP
ncbi:MAG: hypothetical protein V4850_08250 [Myxococcota bacterium]